MRQLAKREEKAPSLLENLLRRLREFATGESDNGGLRETLEDLLEEPSVDERGDKFTEEERALLLNALSFGELRVDDVMVPRADIDAVDVNAGLAEVIGAIRQAGHSRLLVYRDKLDEVVGVVHIKDLLQFWGDGEGFRLADVMRRVLVVPPSMRVLDLLLEMRDTRNHLAAVVDEFGGTDGLVTVEDLVHEILGEIHDEHAPMEDKQLVEAEDGSIEVDARIDLEDLEELLHVKLVDESDEDEVDTLAGLIFMLIDRVPETGERIRHPAGLVFEIVDADPRRIKRVRIHQNSAEAPTAPEAG